MDNETLLTADRPTDDLFPELSKAASTVREFIQDSLSQPFTGPIIGIFGPWGSGKTSFAHKVAHELTKCQLIWFHPTSYKDEGEVAAAFFQSALKQIQVEATGLKRLKVKTRIWRHNQNLPGGLNDLFIQILTLVLRLGLFTGGAILILSLLTSGNLGSTGAALGALLGSTAVIVGLIQKALEPGLNLDPGKFARHVEAKTGDNVLEQYVKEFQWIAGLARSNDNPLVVWVDQIDDGLPIQAALILEALRVFWTAGIPCVFVIMANEEALRTEVQLRLLNQIKNDLTHKFQETLIKMADDYLDRVISYQVELSLPKSASQQKVQRSRRLVVPLPDPADVLASILKGEGTSSLSQNTSSTS